MIGHHMINGKEVSEEEVIEYLNRGKAQWASVSAANQVTKKAVESARLIKDRNEQSA